MKFICSILLTIITSGAFSQVDTITPLYRRFPTLPPVQLILSDSITKYTKEDIPKKTQVLLLFFSPDCEHCQHETEQLVANKESFKDIQIIMVSTYPFYRINEFAEKYRLSSFEHIVIAKDPAYFMLTFYSIHNFPYLALYSKKGKLIDTFQGSQPIEKIIEAFKNSE